jgi:hypothetical protein
VLRYALATRQWWTGKDYLSPSIIAHNFTFQENNMKTFRQLCAASVLILTLTLPASAGWISTTVAPPNPSPTPASAVAGEMQTGIAGQEETGSSEATAADSATEIALNLLQSVLALF